MEDVLFWIVKKENKSSKAVDLLIDKNKMIIFYEFDNENGAIESGLIQLAIQDENQSYSGLSQIKDSDGKVKQAEYILTGAFESWESFRGCWEQNGESLDCHIFIPFEKDEPNWPTHEQNIAKQIEKQNYQNYLKSLPQYNAIKWQKVVPQQGSYEKDNLIKVSFYDDLIVLYYERHYYDACWRKDESGFIYLKKQLGEQKYKGYAESDNSRGTQFVLVGSFKDDSWTEFNGIWTQDYNDFKFSATLISDQLFPYLNFKK